MKSFLCLLGLLISLTALGQAPPVVRNNLTTNQVQNAPADGWFLVSSNNIPRWSRNSGTGTNFNIQTIVTNNTFNTFFNTNYFTNLFTTNLTVINNLTNNNFYNNNSFITNLTVNNNAFISNAVITNLYVSNAFFTNLSVFNTTITSNLFTTNIFSTNAYITNLFVTDFHGKTTFTTNLFATNVFIQFLTNNIAYITNLTVNNITNNIAYITNLFSTTITNTLFVSSNAYITNLTVNNITNQFLITSNAYITNLFTTNLFATTITNNLFVSSNAYITNLFSTNINTTVLVTSNLFTTNIFTTNLTVFNTTITSNLFATNIFTTNLFATTITNVTLVTSNLFTTNLNVFNTLVSSNIFVTNTFTTNLFVLSNAYAPHIFAVDASFTNNAAGQILIFDASSNLVWDIEGDSGGGSLTYTRGGSWTTNSLNYPSNAFMASLTVTNGLTNRALTASTLLTADANKAATSLANGTGFLHDDGSGGFAYQIDGSTLTNLTLKYSTNAIPALTLTFGKAYFTNLAANATLTAFVVGDSAALESLLLFVTNNSGADKTITGPAGVWGLPGSGTPPVYTATNNRVTIFEAYHYGNILTNFWKLDFAP